MSESAVLVESINKAFRGGQFEPFLQGIRFPLFKNLQEGLEIQFTFPVTAILGENGSNKTSILRAIQACPDQYSIGDYWFDTELDHIGTKEGPQRYIHWYRVPSGKIAEVIKSRMEKSNRGPDYFETERPRMRDGMHAMPPMCDEDSNYRNQTRWKSISKQVVYLDFRAQLPAFDILMNFDWRGEKCNGNRSAKKRLVRDQSLRLRKILDDLSSSKVLWSKERILCAAELLSKEEVAEISKILDRDYEEIRVVRHDLFDCIGWTAMLKTKNLEYSEAFAGSGEFAVVMLVHALMNAEDHSLILLDEPETSLHPGAQKALTEFLMRSSLSHKHQIIFSTHSREMVEYLPDNGRKLLGVSRSGKVQLISQSASLTESFCRLGATFCENTVIVEDRLVVEIVKAALRREGIDVLRSYDVRYVAGGAGSLLSQVVPVTSQIETKYIILLDGDMRPKTRPERVPENHQELKEALEAYRISEKNLIRDGGNGDDEAQWNKAAKRVVQWANEHVGYLPGNCCPEALLLCLYDGQITCSSEEAKKAFVELTRKELAICEEEDVNSDDIFNTQRRVLGEIANRGDKTWVKVAKEIVAEIKSKTYE